MKTRPAFTLLEITIVLIMIVGLMAIAWPRMTSASRRSELRDAAMIVKTAFANARDQSVRSGREFHFIYEPGSSKFRVDGSKHNDSDTLTIGSEKGNRNETPSTATSRTLPAALFSIDENSSNKDDTEPKSVTFYPDGRASQAAVYIDAADGVYRIKLSIRGLTGDVTIHPIERSTQQEAQPRFQES